MRDAAVDAVTVGGTCRTGAVGWTGITERRHCGDVIEPGIILSRFQHLPPEARPNRQGNGTPPRRCGKPADLASVAMAPLPIDPGMFLRRV